MTDNTPDVLIWVIPTVLTDGSRVYAVEMPGEYKVDAITEADAADMAQEIVEAINEHSNITAGVQWG